MKRAPKMELFLNDGQREAIDIVCDWYYESNEQVIAISGCAGTGKTSILPYIVKELHLEPEEVLFVAFTGKAASVLIQKGFDATTIHSAFYDLVEVDKVRNGEPVMKNGRHVKEKRFQEKEFIDPRIKLIVVDEWSMVNETLANAMTKHAVPILAMGDPYQLPPITGISPFESKVAYELTEITRQGKNSGIVELATLIREGRELPEWCNFRNDAWVMKKHYLTDKYLMNADIILTAKNKTRNIFNEKIRELHKSKGKLPNMGDKLICRKNCWFRDLDGIPLINGTIGKVAYPIRMDECNLSRGIYRIDFQPDYKYGTEEYYEALPCDYDFIKQPCGADKEINDWNFGVKMEFAEAITVWLAQGSQYNDVIYYDEVVGDDSLMRKLRYTAVTRAVNKVRMYM